MNRITGEVGVFVLAVTAGMDKWNVVHVLVTTVFTVKYRRHLIKRIVLIVNGSAKAVHTLQRARIL